MASSLPPSSESKVASPSLPSSEPDPKADATKADTTKASTKRSVCAGCDRPSRVCLCATFPSGGKVDTPLRVILLQHPQERKQKHQSAQFLLKTLKNVHLVRGKKLAYSDATLVGSCSDGSSVTTADDDGTKSSVSTSDADNNQLHLDLTRTAVLFPAEGAQTAKELHERNSKIDTVIALDATWTLAKQMYRDCPVLSKMRTVTLDCLSLPPPRFLVRKPERIKPEKRKVESTLENVKDSGVKSSTEIDGSTKIDDSSTNIDDSNKSDINSTGPSENLGHSTADLGHSTAEAVAIFLDQFKSAQKSAKDTVMKPQKSDTVIYDAVMKPLNRYVELQMAFTNGNEKHRTDRKDYVPNMYAELQEAKRRKLA